MERVSTGFPKLDEILDGGLSKPSCTSISGQFHQSHRNFTLQLVNNFLQNGQKGIYLCLDRPAGEVRSQFKGIGIDINPFTAQNYLFFLDFFTYSQKALIETSTFRTLEYTPRLLLDTISPFLDWIRDGFIIIDTLSTLMLNMTEKEAYEFMRGLKLLGRAFNLVCIEVTHLPVAELEAVTSNSDGNLQFKESALFVNRFENIPEIMLLVTSEKDGKIALKSPFGNKDVQEKEIPLLEALSTSKALVILPNLALAPSVSEVGAVEELSERIKPLEENNVVAKTPYCSTVHCSNCNSDSMEMYLQCPECQSRLLDKGDIIEHFCCGNVGFETGFIRGDKLVCQKCNSELKQLGVDYRRVGVGYSCENKHIFSLPKIVFVCTKCREKFDLNEAKLETSFSYELTELGKRQAIQAGYHPDKSPVSFLFKEPVKVSP
jgi:KaiC/GvpD/RAD55 family RecA-like ATPase/DNA-directed RNA polymerase subunit RPC12/RpoP